MKVNSKTGELDYDKNKVANAISRAFASANNVLDDTMLETLVEQVTTKLRSLGKKVLEKDEVLDSIEDVLMANRFFETARVFIRYRFQHVLQKDIGSPAFIKKMFHKYIGGSDWKIKENSNMGYSLQGLNNYIISEMTASFWLDYIYPKAAGASHKAGYIHIHDLGLLSVYCVGWDLKDLLIRGFGGVPGKLVSGPAKHFSTALGQIVNFFYTLQGESSGAQAFSNFDTYLAPFIRHDGLTYKQVKQELQSFIFNINVPTRVGFQCVSEDTEIFTPEGWKTYSELKEGQNIYTMNLKDNSLQEMPIQKLNIYEYDGPMYHVKNRIQDYLVTPNHNMIRKPLGCDTYRLEEAKDISKLKSPFITPIACATSTVKGIDLSLNEIRFLAWIYSDGHYDKTSRRFVITQSERKNSTNCKEIRIMLSEMGVHYEEHDRTGDAGHPLKIFNISYKDTSRLLLKLFPEGYKKELPLSFLNMNMEQARAFLDVFWKAEKAGKNTVCGTNHTLMSQLQGLCVLAGYGTTLRKTSSKTIANKDMYLLRYIKHTDTHIPQLKLKKYKGKVWCPTTDNGTFIARRKGKVFLTGNSPFTNVTLDLAVPKHLANEPIIIGGQMQDSCYGDYRAELDIFNKAFFEVLLEGDSQGRIFTFPIPTVNITKDFDWANKKLDSFWEATAKYGIPYFANYINSSMSPEDSRSMCFTGNTFVLYQHGGKRGRTTFANLYNRYGDTPIEVLADGKFVKALPIKVKYTKPFVKLTLANGQSYVCTQDHLHKTQRGDLPTSSLKVGDKLCYSSSGIQWDGVGSYEFGKFLGLYLAEGSSLGDDIQFSLSKDETDLAEFILDYVNKYLGKHGSVTKNTGESISVFISGKGTKDIVGSYISGKALNKRLINWWKLSTVALQGLWDGWMLGDGNYKRTEGYTKSEVLADQLCEIANILGIKVRKRCKHMTSSFKGKTYEGELYTLYLCNTDEGRIYTQHSGYTWVEIIDISLQNDANKVAYCVEVLEGDPYFELPSGLITHNCCRLRLSLKELQSKGGGLFGANSLTGSIGVVTLNLPMIAYEANGALDKFYTGIATQMDIARDALEAKRKVLEDLTNTGLYPYSRHYLEAVKKRDGKYWANHFSTIGLVGVAEAAANLDIKYNSPEGRKFGEDVLTFMRNRLLSYQKDTGNFYNLEATPAEGASYKLALLARKKYPKIITAGGADPYFTNSSQLPANTTGDIYEILEHQKNMQTLYTGGTVMHLFLGERIQPSQAKTLVRKIMETYPVPYISITPTFSVCPVHGYIAGEHQTCPKCLEEKKALADKIAALKEKGK